MLALFLDALAAAESLPGWPSTDGSSTLSGSVESQSSLGDYEASAVAEQWPDWHSLRRPPSYKLSGVCPEPRPCRAVLCGKAAP